MNLDLPYSLNVGGKERKIYPDFRDILTILTALSDPDLDPASKRIVMLTNLYVDDWQKFADTKEALEQAIRFIDGGREYKDKSPSPRLMDWEQDFPIIIAPVNRLAGKEIRELPFLHWWTFLGYYQEIGECTFSNIVGIRQKLMKGKKLESYEREYLRTNRDTVILRTRLSEDEQSQEDEFFYGG